MNERGQALIEVAVFFMLSSVLLAGLCGFTQWILVRQRVLIAAEEAAMLYSSGHFTRAEVEREVKLFLETGMPALPPERVRVRMGRASGLSAWTFELDKVSVSYERPGGWYTLLGVNPVVEEFFVIKHAPHYWAPFQKLFGPAVPWNS